MLCERILWYVLGEGMLGVRMLGEGMLGESWAILCRHNVACCVSSVPYHVIIYIQTRNLKGADKAVDREVGVGTAPDFNRGCL